MKQNRWQIKRIVRNIKENLPAKKLRKEKKERNKEKGFILSMVQDLENQYRSKTGCEFFSFLFSGQSVPRIPNCFPYFLFLIVTTLKRFLARQKMKKGQK
jgi:hypothetical protein